MAGFIILLALAHFSHHVLTALLTPLLPFIRDDFSLSYAQSGLVVSAFTLAYGITQLPAGWAADRIGPRYLLLVGISGVAIAGALVGLSNSYLLLIGTLFLVGIAGGAYHPSASSFISSRVPVGNRGRVLGLHIIGGSISHFVSPLIAAGLVAVSSWRGAFLALAAPVLLLGIAVFAIQERRLRLQPRTDGTTEDTPSRDGHSIPGEAAEIPQSIPRIVVFLVLAGFISAVTASIISYIPLHLVDSFGVDGKVSAAFLSILFAAGFFAAPLGGFLSDRLGSIRVMLGLGLLAGPLFLMTPHISFGVPFAVLLLLIGTVVYVKMTTAETFIAASVPKRLRGTVLGIYFFSGVEGSALFTPLLGSMIDRWGFEKSFNLTGWVVLVFVVGAGVFFLASRRQNQIK